MHWQRLGQLTVQGQHGTLREACEHGLHCPDLSSAGKEAEHVATRLLQRRAHRSRRAPLHLPRSRGALVNVDGVGGFKTGMA